MLRSSCPAAVVIASAAAGFAVGWSNTNVGAGAPALASAYGVHVGAIGLLLTAMLACHVALQLPAGRLVDRASARTTALIGLSAMTVGHLAPVAAPDFALAVAARGVTGCGVALAFVAAVAYIRAAGGGAMAQGLFGGLNLSGGALAIVAVPRVEDALSWRAPFVTAAAVTAASLALMALAPPVRRVATAAPVRHGVLRDRGLYRIGIGHTVSLGFSIVIGSWIIVVVQAHSELDARAAGLIGALTLLGGIASRPLGGWLVHHRPHLVTAVVGASMLIGGLGAVGLAMSGSALLLFVAAVAVGVGAGVPFVPSFTAAVDRRPDAPGSAVALINLTAGVVALIFAPVVGATLRLDPQGRLGFLLIAVVWIGAIVVLPRRNALRS